jgi:hypothetical protein
MKASGEVQISEDRRCPSCGGPLGRAVVIIIGAIAELERNLIIGRVRAGCAAPAWKAGISAGGHSTSTGSPSSRTATEASIAKAHSISRVTVSRLLSRQESRLHHLDQKGAAGHPLNSLNLCTRNHHFCCLIRCSLRNKLCVMTILKQFPVFPLGWGSSFRLIAAALR